MISAFIKSFLIVIASIGLCNAANASNPVCRIIEAVPFVIDKGGCYYLTKDLFVSDISTNAITVLADDVTLDLAGQRIVGPDLPNVNGVGVYGLNIKNLHLKNGKISGFLYGVRIDGEDLSTRIYIRKIQALKNYFRGVAVLASDSIIEYSVIKNTGGTTLFPDSFAIGVEVIGSNSVIRGNLIDGVNPVGVGEGIGISLSRKRANSVVEKNIIKGGESRGSSFGVWLSMGNEVTEVRKNKIYGFILPFSLPRESGTWINAKRAGSITSRIHDNKSFATACGILEYPAIYDGLHNSNVVMSRSKGGGCPLLISNLTPKHYQNRNDAYIAFRLAQAMYWCSDAPQPPDHICLNLMRQSISLFEHSEGLGVKEATRILPAIRKAVSAYRLEIVE